MPKNQVEFSLVGKLDANDIMSGIQKIKNDLSKEKLGDKLFESSSKGLQDIENRLKKVMSNIPGSGSTPKQLAAFEHSIKDIATELSQWEGKLKGFELTDKYLASNIQSVKDLLEVFDEYSEKIKGMQDKMGNFSIERVKGSQILGRIDKTAPKMIAAAQAGDYAGLKSGQDYLLGELKNKLAGGDISQETFNAQAAAINKFAQQLRGCITIMKQYQQQADAANTDVEKGFEEARQAAEQNRGTVVNSANEQIEKLIGIGDAAKQGSQGLQELSEREKSIQNLTNRIKYLFSATSVFSVLRRVVRGAVKDFQELDKEFNEIAIVSRYSTAEMWQSFSQVNQMAQEYGVTTKNILEVQNLYYHQGKDMAEVNKLTAQTLTLAKITGMDYADATNKLTAALNAYKLTAEDAVRVTDTVAALSANAATSSEELMTALTKTASIAANAGVSLENTEVFLTKMIETTREAPENLGTALKTIVARFGEVKNAIDENGEAIEQADINKVDKALKTVGITLLDTSGQMRDLDDVFMELSSKWDGLDRNTQRYIATMAAGSRQQSRFIAMMENYDRTLELVDVAQNSAGTGARQLAKAQESIETSLNRLKSAWQEFYSGIITSGAIKWFIELGNSIVGIFNKINKIPAIGPYISLIVGGLGLWATKTFIVDKALEKLGATIATNIGLKEKDNAVSLKSRIIQNGEIVSFKKLIHTELTEWATKKALSDENVLYILKQKGVDLSNKNTSISFKVLAAAELEAYGPLLLIIAAMAVLVAAGYGILKLWEKEHKVITDNSEALDELSKKYDEYQNQVQKTKALKDNLNILEKYKDMLVLTTEQQEELKNAQQSIAEDYPTLLNYIDEEGNYHLRNADAIALELENQKKLNKEKRNAYISKNKELVNQGIYGEDFASFEQAQNRLNYLSQSLNLSSKSSKEQANKITKDIIGYGKIVESLKIAGEHLATVGTLGAASPLVVQGGVSAYRNEQLRKMLEGYLSGTKKSFMTQDLNTVFGAGASINEQQFKKFRDLAANQDLTDFKTFSKTLSESNIQATSQHQLETWYNNYMQIVEKIPEIGDMITKGYSQVEAAWEQTLNVSLSEIDFEFSVTAESKEKFAKAFAKAFTDDENFTEEDFLRYMEGLDEETYNKIFNKILSSEKLELGEIFGKALTPESLATSDLDKIMSSYLKELDINKNSPEYQAYKQSLIDAFTFTKDELNAIQNVILLDGETIEGYTLEQIKAMQQTAAKLQEVYGKDAGQKYLTIKQNIQNGIKDINDFEKAINALNTADVSDLEGIEKFVKQMKQLNVSTKVTSQTIVDLAGGLDELPLENTADIATYCKNNIDSLKDSVEALNAASEGTATAEQMQQILNILIEGLDFKESIEMIHNFNNALTYTSKGIGLNSTLLQKAQVDLATGEKTTTEVILTLLDARIKKRRQELALMTDGTEKEKAEAEILSMELNKTLITMSANTIKQEIDHAVDPALEKMKEKMDRIKEAWQNFVDYLNNVDKYSNLDALLDRIKDKIDNLEFEISFSTNPKEIAKDLKSQLNEIQRQMAGNIAGKRGAERNLLARRNAINSNSQTKDYLSFGAEGNIIIDQQKMLALEEQIRDAKIKNNEVTLAVLEGQKKAIEDNVKAYNDELKAVQKYTKGVQDSLDKTQNINKEIYENVIELENKLIDVIQKKEDKELELTKKKYDAIKEEDNKYLDSVRKMIDKERALREQKNDEDAVRDKERKLAMMKMDTSGIYSSEIRALEKELKQDYQDLSDKAVDRMVDQLEEENNARAEAMDKDVYYTETTLERKRELMTDYYEEIKQLDTDLVTWFMNNDEEYLKASKAQKELLKQQYAELVGNGEASKEVLQDGSITSVQQAITLAQESATDLDEAIKLYGDNAKVTNEGVQSSVSELAGEYSNLVNIIDGNGDSLVSAYNNLREAIKKAAEAARDLKDAQEKAANFSTDNVKDQNPSKNTTSTLSPYTKTSLRPITVKDKNGNINYANKEAGWYHESGSGIVEIDGTKYYRIRSRFQEFNDSPRYAKESDFYGKNEGEIESGNGSLNKLAKSETEIFTLEEISQIIAGQNKYNTPKMLTNAKGGLVDFTGPTWVDGTKANPEAFLSAADTANIAKLRDILSIAFDSTAPTYPNSQSTSNATYNITIEVDSIASDYDVDQAVSHLQSKIQQASGYRNINILKKSK